MADSIHLNSFSVSMIRPNSIITIIGKNTNYQLLYKEYGKHFESAKQFASIMNDLADNEALVLDETCPRNKMTDMVFRLKFH
jgi:hypothetical protein